MGARACIGAMRQAMVASQMLVALVVMLGGSVEGQAAIDSMTAVAPDVELSVYGSGSFKTGGAIGDAGYSDEKGYTRLMLSGAQSEMSFHDRNEVACKADKRWNLYASEKKLRTHRPGGKGGFVISEDMTRFLQDLNIGGIIAMKTLSLQGAGPRKSDSSDGEPLLIGSKAAQHLTMGYDNGHSWIQSVKTHISLSPGKTPIVVGGEKSTGVASLTVDGGHLRVNGKLTIGGSDGTASISETHLRFANGGGFKMTDTSYLKSIGDRPVYTKGGGKFMGNVGVGTLPKFPTFRLQVHIKKPNEHGAVMVTDKADRGLTLGQTKEGALLRSWNLDSKQHEAMLVEAGPLLIQPRNGVVLFGTTVRKANMHLHVEGNLYIHGHMYAMRNLHVRDHAKLAHLLMPNMNLKNKPQSPDGDTLVLGHIVQKKEDGKQELAPWEDPAKMANVITGVNLRFGFHSDYVWVQVHGTKKGHHFPLALNPLGNTVAIGTTVADKRYSLHAAGNGYVLGTLYVKYKAGEVTATVNTEITDYSQLMPTEDAPEVLSLAKVQRTNEEDLLRSRLTLIDVPEKLKASDSHEDASVQKVTAMVHTVLAKQERHMHDQDTTLTRQAAKI